MTWTLHSEKLLLYHIVICFTAAVRSVVPRKVRYVHYTSANYRAAHELTLKLVYTF